MFNPIAPEGTDQAAVVTADLWDDLADVAHDGRQGALLLQKEERKGHLAALWHWRFTFENHWGHHAVDALRAIIWRLTTEFPGDWQSIPRRSR